MNNSHKELNNSFGEGLGGVNNNLLIVFDALINPPAL